MSSLSRHAAALSSALAAIGDVESTLESAAAAIAHSLAHGGTVLVAGNGGSAAEAQHMTAELLGRLHPARERRPLAAIALHADTSTLTAVANDYGFDEIFSRQVEALGRPEDVLVVFSTSGRSRNLVRAVEVAIAIGMATVAFVGSGPSPLHDACTYVLAAPSTSIPTVQECHLVLLHVLVECAEDRMGFQLPSPDGATPV